MGTMSMLNHAAVEALCSASYMENFLDAVESMPDDLQRNVSTLRELDVLSREHLENLAFHQNAYLSTSESQQKKKSLIQVQRALVKCQEIGDEKLQIVAQIIDCVEGRAKQLDQDLENLDPGSTEPVKKEEPKPKKTLGPGTSTPPVREASNKPSPSAFTTPVAAAAVASPTRSATPTKVQPTKTAEERLEKIAAKRQRRQRMRLESHNDEEKKTEEQEKPKKKRRRKVKKEKENTSASNKNTHIDYGPGEDEPTYCLCDRISYGEMVGCDNEDCAIEWFHFNCVALTHKPKGKWFCPNCRGEKANMQKH